MSGINSLYISFVDVDVSKKKIAEIFWRLDLAIVKSVTFARKVTKYGKPYNSAFVYIRSWKCTVSAIHFQNKLRGEAEEARIVYDDPLYWIVKENNSERPLRIEEEKFEDYKNIIENNWETLDDMMCYLEAIQLQISCGLIEYAGLIGEAEAETEALLA